MLRDEVTTTTTTATTPTELRRNCAYFEYDSKSGVLNFWEEEEEDLHTIR